MKLNMSSDLQLPSEAVTQTFAVRALPLAPAQSPTQTPPRLASAPQVRLRTSSGARDPGLPRGERQVLTAIAQHPAGVTREISRRQEEGTHGQPTEQ
jgi:hypothetical protein